MKKKRLIKIADGAAGPKIADNNWFYIQAKRAVPIIKLISHLIPILPLRLNVTVQRNISRWELLSQRSTQRRFCLILIDFHQKLPIFRKIAWQYRRVFMGGILWLSLYSSSLVQCTGLLRNVDFMGKHIHYTRWDTCFFAAIAIWYLGP